MSDIRVKFGFPGNVKTKQLSAGRAPHPGWSLLVLWCYAGQNKPDGELAGMSDAAIESAADWTGEAGALVRLLLEVGFLEGEAGARYLHDWDDHQPWLVGSEARSEHATLASLSKYHGREKAKNILKSRRRRKTLENKEQLGLLGADPEHAPSPSPSPTPSPTPKEEDGRAARASRLPKPFVMTPEWKLEADRIVAERAAVVDVGDQFQRFCDYWWDKSGRDATKVDWIGTWRNWIRSACDRAGGAGGGGGPKRAPNGAAEAAFAEVRRAIAAGRRPRQWTSPYTEPALGTIGGLGKLKYASSGDLDFRYKREFVDAFAVASAPR